MVDRTAESQYALPMKDFEKKLTQLVERVYPAQLRISYGKLLPELEAILPASMKRRKHYHISYQTRSFDEGASGHTVREAIENTLDSLDNGFKDVDRGLPNWSALSRMQREVVEHTLKGLVAEHKARAAAKNLAHERDAHIEYAIADAFDAALECLEIEYQNEPSTVWEPLQARNGPPVRKPTDPVEESEEPTRAAKAAKRKKLSSTVKNLRAKNRKRAAK
jgi:hypothetical protein